MDREALRRQSAARRTGAETEVAPERSLWKCDYCARGFVGERAFMNHVCKERIRFDELQSPEGQAAYLYYSEWMKAHKRSVPPVEKFGESRFFSTFFKFAQHVKKVHIPNPKVFIKVMVENGDVSPALWCRDSVYSMYLQGYDQSVPPEKQFLDSLQLMEELARDYEVALPQVFETVPHSKLLELIERRKLSYWFLLASKAFRQYLTAHEDRKDDIERAMNLSAVITRVRQEPYLFKDLNKAAEEVGL